MKGFLKELQEGNAAGGFETVRTGEVSLTPNKWHTMAVISGTGKLLQADLFGSIPYSSSGANIGEGAWDMRILIDGEIFADVRMAVTATSSGVTGHLLATDFTYLLPSLEGRNTIYQQDLFGNLQIGSSYVNILAEKITEGKSFSSSATDRKRLHERDSVYRIPSFSTLFGDTDGFSFYESIGDIAGGAAVPWERGHCLSIRREMRWSGCRRKKRTQAAWSGTIKTVLRYDF